MNPIERVRRKARLLDDIVARLDKLQHAVGRLEMRQIAALDDASDAGIDAQMDPGDLHAREFQVYSQWGEDGILQYLTRRVPIAHRVFVEIGVEDYREANTRFLAEHDNWAGLLVDGSAEQIAAIRQDRIYWACNLKAVAQFVTAENMNALLVEQGVTGDIGLLSIDVDGNDYWLWQAIDAVSPRIVVCEYKSLLGSRRPVVVPYAADFRRTQAHHSWSYYGASLPALEHVSRGKGYALVGTNSAGNNAFFVRADLIEAARLPARTSEEVYTPARFREAHDPAGNLTYLDHAAAQALISDLPVYDVLTGTTLPLRQALAAGEE